MKSDDWTWEQVGLRNRVRGTRRKGHYRRRSGRSRGEYWDLSGVVLAREHMGLWANGLYRLLHGGKVEIPMLAAPDGPGTPILGAMLAAGHASDAVRVHTGIETYGARSGMEGSIPHQKAKVPRVAVVDAVAGSGRALMLAVGAIRCQWPQAKIACAVILDLEEGAAAAVGEAGSKLQSLYRRSELVEEEQAAA